MISVILYGVLALFTVGYFSFVYNHNFTWSMICIAGMLLTAGAILAFHTIFDGRYFKGDDHDM